MSHSDVRVDVVIPTIGRDSLRRAVQSANLQTSRPNVFVVLDRLSERRAVQELLKGLDYAYLETDGGVGGAAARNVGLQAGSSDYVAFLDDDDWWDSQHLSNRLQVADSFTKDHNRLIVLGRFVHESAERSTVIPIGRPNVEDPQTLINYMLKRDRLRFGRNALQTSSILFSRGILSEVAWDNELPKHQDWDLIARLSMQPNARFLWDARASVHVQKDSPASVSKHADWRASFNWWRSLEGHVSGRASSDFIAVHVLRSALRARDYRGVRTALASMLVPPHISALVLGFSGVLK